MAVNITPTASNQATIRSGAVATDPSLPGLALAGLTDGVILTSTNGGANWSRAQSGITDATITALAVAPDGSGASYAGTAGAGAVKSDSSGGAFHPVNNGLTLTRAVAVASIRRPRQRSTPPRMLLAWSRVRMAAPRLCQLTSACPCHSTTSLVVVGSTPTTLYVGTTAGVFKSADGGGNWANASAGLPAGAIQALASDPGSTVTLYAAVGGRIFKTANAAGSGAWRATGSAAAP